MRAAHTLDNYVEAIIVARLKRKDAADLLTKHDCQVDTAALAREATAVRTRITELGDLFEEGLLPKVEYRERRARLKDKLTQLEVRQKAAAGRDPLAGIAGRADAGQVWKRLDLGRKRAILNELLVVTVLPAPHGRMPDGSRFDARSIDVRPARKP